MFRLRPRRRRHTTPRPRRIQLEKLETRQLLAADSIGVTPEDTGEFLLGTVGVTPVFFESNGQIDPDTQNWSNEEIDEVLAKITDSVNWWSDTLDTLNTVHTLEFVIDDTFARDPVETPYEPIDNRSSHFNTYVGDFLTAQGYGNANSIEDGVRQFNHAQREQLGTDWAFTIFVVDSSDDENGLFEPGGPFVGAFAFAGGLFYVTPSARPVTTYTHELGHIFWARDEYAGGGSYTDRRGYYDTQNLNAHDNPAGGQEISIMRGGIPLDAAFDANFSPASTLAFVGWQDSDGDGVFDLADVPLELEAEGYFDAATSMYQFSGSASAMPLINRNSSGPQSDITLNRISQLQYSLDDGPWLVAAEPDAQVTDFDFSMEISQPFSSIRWRVIDLSTGITSPVVEGTSALPAQSASSISGLAFIDSNADGQRDATEATLAMTEIVVRAGDGSDLFGGNVDAATLPDGEIGVTPGVTVTADGVVSDPDVGSFVSEDAGQQRVFHSFDMQRNRWIERWSSKVALQAQFDQPVGEVSLSAIGLEEMSFARLEAYDSNGQLIGRTTSGGIDSGQQVRVEVTDSMGRIASIRAFGHAGTSVGLRDLQFGSGDTVLTGPSGGWQIKNLPDGEYLVDLVPERLIHQFAQSTLSIEVIGGTTQAIIAPATRVDSPRYNELLAEDANQDGEISSRDALVIINDLSRFEPRNLQPSETTGFDIDVNNDGAVSALDALLVINALQQQNEANGEFAQDSSVEGRSSESSDQRALAVFNSAGGTTTDTSADHGGADTTGEDRTTRGKIQDFALISRRRLNLEVELEGESAGNVDQQIDLNQPEISEPFVRLVI